MKKKLLTLFLLLCPILFGATVSAWNDVYLLCSDNSYNVNETYKFTKVSDNSFYYDLPVSNITGGDFWFRFSVDPNETWGHKDWGPASNGDVISSTDYSSASENSGNAFKIEQNTNAQSCRINLNYIEASGSWAWHITATIMETPQDFTVAIADPGWNEVYAYAYTDATPVATWPGIQLGRVDGKYTYTYTGYAAPANIVFNNGDGNGIQTPDLAFVNGKTYSYTWTLVGATSYEDTEYNWHDYTTEPIFGTAWNTDLAANDMEVSADGTTWTITKSNVVLTEDVNHLQFKAIFGHEGWTYNVGSGNDGAYGGNVHLQLAAGTYNITFTLVRNGGSSTLTAEASKDFTVAINDPGWTEVWAYAYTGETPVVAWPGTKLTKVDGKYTYTYNGTVAPANVVFNNGDGNGLQTPDLAFTDGTTYTDVWTIMGATQNSAWQNYTIEPIFTTAWTADVAGNDMTPSADGKTWTWTKSGVELEANTHIKYKATFGHCGTDYAVGTNEGDGMKVLDITDAGTYDLTFTFTRDGNTFAVNAEAVHAVTATKFTVAGSNSTLFDGYYWEPNPKTGDEYNNVNDMALVDGVWTITKTGKLLQAGNIEWKVAFDNAYNSYYGGIKGGDGDDKNDPGTNNAVLNIPVVGTYSVTFTYNPTTRKVNAVATKTADYDITSWCIAGNSAAGNVLGAGDWGFVDANLMTDQGDGKTWKLVKTPVTFTQAGTFEFKAFANKENIVVYPEGANASMAITAEDIAAGNYTLTFTLDTDAKTLVATKELVQNTYTATYVNTEDWENVYAYAWSGDGGSATIHTATWPGNKLTEKEATQVDGHDVYKFSIVLSAAPEKIIFNGGDGQPQTANLDFVDGKQYSFVATDTYTVAGSSTQLFGAEWNYSEGSGNDMTKGEGTSTVYTKSYANVALSAGNIEYKVFKAYNKSTTFPAENAILTIATMGMYNVTFTFDASTNDVSAVAEPQGDIPLTYSYVLAGSTAVTGYNWDFTGAHNVMTAKGDGTYSLTVEDKTLEVGDNDGFKVVKLGTYGGKVYETTWIPDGMGNNKTVAIGEKGIYTITFTYDPTPGAANDGIAYSATPTQIEVPAISATGYATYSSAYALDFTDVTAFNAYIATGLDAQKQVVMAPAQQKVPAETGLVLAAEGGCEATLVPVAASAPAIGDNLLVAHVAAGDVAASAGSEYRYVLAKKGDEVGFYKLATTLNLPANRAYLQTTEALATNSTGKVSLIFDDDETTNINALTLGRSALDPTQPMYNISGQRVGNDYKGIVIQNGKKYVNK